MLTNFRNIENYHIRPKGIPLYVKFLLNLVSKVQKTNKRVGNV